jgi:chromosome segregation ATPase
MNEQTAARIVELLESIDGQFATLREISVRLEAVADAVREIKMDISGFTHEGESYPGGLAQLNTSLERIHSELEGLKLTVDLIERKMPEAARLPQAPSTI